MKVYDRPHLLCCKCPFESTSSKMMDSGRNTYNIMKIKSAFEWAYNTLLSNARHKNNNRKSILGLLVGIRGQMLQIRSKDNKILKFQTPQKLKKNMSLSNTMDLHVINISDSSSEDDNEHGNDTELFIPFNDTESSPSTSSSSSSLTSSSSSSYDSYNTYDNNENMIATDELPYYEASEFQQKHLFNTHSNTSPKKNDITFSFEGKNIDLEHNPYLNKKYDAYRGQKKKRKFSNSGGDGSKNKAPNLKKRKTTSSVNMHKLEGKDGSDVKLSRSYSMPDLRGSTPCIFYKKGGCKKGETCPFQHGEDDVRGVKDNELLMDGNANKTSECIHFVFVFSFSVSVYLYVFVHGLLFTKEYSILPFSRKNFLLCYLFFFL